MQALEVTEKPKKEENIMALFKCKMCGGDLVLTKGMSVAECEYCGSMQTLPKVSDERLGSFYERANDLRMSHEFDKATEIYEKIIEENPTDADAYWSMVLCRYGVEYVEETVGGIRKPTINRAQMVSVFEDVNYRSAIKYADVAQKRVYEEEAARIDRILQRYLEISRNEPAYDVFICYKETGADGRRTIDSVRAGEIYRELTQEGFRVFFAPVTLENKLGEDYEPYIFAAIHSAKVMVVVGTKPEHMSAVWVKNEWSRFLALAKEDSKKTLIPVYSGMDPYDMPEAFRFKQAQNMEKLGFMLDLVRGIEKLVGREPVMPVSQPVTYTEAPSAPANVAPLLQRAAMFLEDRDWDSAGIYCEKVLDIDPTNGKAYVYKLLVEAKVSHEGALQRSNMPLENMRAYKNAVRYADEPTTSRLMDWNQAIKDRRMREEMTRNEQERIRKEQAQLEEQQRKERVRAAEEQRKKKQALANATDNATAHLQAKVQEKEWLESLLATKQSEVAVSGKKERKIRFLSIILLINSILLFVMATGNAEGTALVGFLCITEFVFALILAGARGKSKVAAFLLIVPTCFIFPMCSAVKGLLETKQYSKTAAKKLQEELASLRSQIQQLENDINLSRNALLELNSQMETFDNTKGN